MEAGLSDMTGTDGSKAEDSRARQILTNTVKRRANPQDQFRPHAELVLAMQKLGHQMKLLDRSDILQANNNRTDDEMEEELRSLGEKSKDITRAFGDFVIDFAGFIVKMGFDIDSITQMLQDAVSDQLLLDAQAVELERSYMVEQESQFSTIADEDMARGQTPDKIKDKESVDQETEEEDLNLDVENFSDDAMQKLGGQMKQLDMSNVPSANKDRTDGDTGKADTNDAGYSLRNKNDAGETYIRYGPYVYVIGSETKAEHNYDEIDGCPICYDLDHWNLECPWLDGVPQGKTVGGMYDIQCKGCDKIGFACCSAGVRPILRECFLCFNPGHWSDKCLEYKYMPLEDYPQYP